MPNFWEEKSFESIGEGDLRLLYCGHRIANLSHAYPPHNSDRYVLSLVTEGEAEFTQADGNSFPLRAKYLYVLFPHSNGSYRTKPNVPWSIKWFVATGEQIGQYLALLGITPKKPYLYVPVHKELEALLDELFLKFNSYLLTDRILCLSLVHRFFSVLAEASRTEAIKNERIQKAVNLIPEHYREPLSVSDLAASLGYHPNYFTKLFRAETGHTPYELLSLYRFDHAKRLLEHTDQTIAEIATSVGFPDPLYFSRAFKKASSVSPMEYRKRLTTP